MEPQSPRSPVISFSHVLATNAQQRETGTVNEQWARLEPLPTSEDKEKEIFLFACAPLIMTSVVRLGLNVSVPLLFAWSPSLDAPVWHSEWIQVQKESEKSPTHSLISISI